MSTSDAINPLHHQNHSQVNDPAYYAPKSKISKIFPEDSMPVRIFYAVLPFIALHKPFGKIITSTAHFFRVISSIEAMVEKEDAAAFFKTMVTISIFVGTIFFHPIGLCISNINDFGYDLIKFMEQLQLGNYQEVVPVLFSMLHHLCYLGTIMTGALEIVAISMLINIIMEVLRSRKEFNQGKTLEGYSHLLMGIVRTFQALPKVEKVAYKHNIYGKEVSRSLVQSADKIRNHTAFFFYSSSRFFIDPQWKITNMCLNTFRLTNDKEIGTMQKCSSVAKTAFVSGLLMPFALSGLILGQTCHFTAFLLSTTPYIHLHGNPAAHHKSPHMLSVFQLNCCLPSGGFAQMFGGLVMPNEQRIEQIAALIKESRSDIVGLQEVSDLRDAFALYNALSFDYKEFYFHIGSTPFIMQNNSGLFVAAKTPIEEFEFHSFSDISNTEKMVNKGFVHFSTKIAHFVLTHLSPSADDFHPTQEEILARRHEQNAIIEAIQKNTHTTYVLGDLNINCFSPEHQGSPLFIQGEDHYDHGEEISDLNATAATQDLIDRNWKHQKHVARHYLILDYFLSFFGHNRPDSIRTRKISTFDVNNAKKALSDHAALYTELHYALSE